MRPPFASFSNTTDKNRTLTMKTILLLTAIIFTAAARADEQVISTFSWKELADAGKLTVGTLTGAPDNALKVENRGPGAMSATVLTIVQPKITTDFYAVTGEVRYDNVEGDGFLEMWSHFGETAAYFSRTLGAAGPMAKLTGTSHWRAFTLPFNAKGASSRPSKLTLNVQLPGKGGVFLRNLKLVQSTSFDGATTQIGSGWSYQTAGIVGGVGGALIGCLGALIEWLAARGKAQRFVVNAVRVLIGVGVAFALGGLAAVALRQPYGVWYALLLLGVLMVVIFPFRLRSYQDRYREFELRRMTSMDATAR
jgi:hypothetical protein